MSKINIKIEGVPYQVEAGMTILEAAKACGYEIPSLCTFNHGECSRGSCRVCLVEATGARGLVASCVYPVAEGMEITISSPKATAARRISVELLLSNHLSQFLLFDHNILFNSFPCVALKASLNISTLLKNVVVSKIGEVSDDKNFKP